MKIGEILRKTKPPVRPSRFKTITCPECGEDTKKSKIDPNIRWCNNCIKKYNHTELVNHWTLRWIHSD